MVVELAVLAIMVFALVLYLIFGGADFGAGVWEFNTALQATTRERNLLYHAIGPVWETNHVWLIFVLVLWFGAFPGAFGSVNEAVTVPLFLALVGIVFRGAAYAFRSSMKTEDGGPTVWLAAFAIASVMAPFFLGAAIGAIASGQLEFDSRKAFVGSHLTGWINPLSLYCGFFTVGLCVYLSATFMVREAFLANCPDLQKIWRRRALINGWCMGVMAAAGLCLIAAMYPHLRHGFWALGWPAIAVSLLAGVTSLWAIHNHRLLLGPMAVAVASGAVVSGWSLAQYPDLVPGVWTIQEAAADPKVLNLMLGVTVVGLLFLTPAIILLFKIFKSSDRNA